MKEGPGQKPIKINTNLWTELDRWLRTDSAKKLGYYSKAQFATEAVRELLNKHKKTEFGMPEELVEHLRKNYKQTSKTSRKEMGVSSFEEYVNYCLEIGIRPDKRTEHRT